MTITATAPYGTFNFPDGTKPEVIQRVMKEYASKAKAQPQPTAEPVEGMTKPGPAPEGPGMLTRIWRGLTGADSTKAGAVGMGIGDTAVGATQALAHTGMIDPDALASGQIDYEQYRKEVPKFIDQAVAQREQQYQQGRQAVGRGGADIARIWGNLIGSAPLAALPGGAAARGAGLARQIGSGLLGGAAAGGIGGATQPVTNPRANFAAEKLKQAGLGAAVGGTLGAATNPLASALAKNIPGLVDSYFRQAVKPPTGSARTFTQMDNAAQQVKSAVNSIVANKDELRFATPEGMVKGELPKTLHEFTQAIEQTRQKIFDQYDAMAKEAGDAGVRVELAPIVSELQKLQKSTLIDTHPGIAGHVDGLVSRFAKRGSYTPAQAQEVVQRYNAALDAFYKNPTYENATITSIDAMVANRLRGELDDVIEKSVAPGYQALRKQYGDLKSIEQNVVRAAQREANRTPGGGLFGGFGNLMSADEILRGIVTLNPKALATGGALKGLTNWMRYLRSPNRAVSKLFDAATREPAGPVRQAAGAAVGVVPTITGAAASRAIEPAPMRYEWKSSPHRVDAPPGP